MARNLGHFWSVYSTFLRLIPPLLCELGAYSTVVAWYSVWRTGDRLQSSSSSLPGDSEPSTASDDWRHRELVKERQEQVGDAGKRVVGRTGQRLRGWQRSTCRLYIVHCRLHTLLKYLPAAIRVTLSLCTVSDLLLCCNYHIMMNKDVYIIIERILRTNAAVLSLRFSVKFWKLGRWFCTGASPGSGPKCWPCCQICRLDLTLKR